MARIAEKLPAGAWFTSKGRICTAGLEEEEKTELMALLRRIYGPEFWIIETGADIIIYQITEQ